MGRYRRMKSAARPAIRVLWQGVNESGSGMNDKSIVDGVGTRPILILSEIRPHSCAELVPVHAAVEERGFRRHRVPHKVSGSLLADDALIAFGRGIRDGPADDFRKAVLPASKYQKRRRFEVRLMP